MKAQGSLEYLLILAAILAIAVVVVVVANSMLNPAETASNIQQDKYRAAQAGWELEDYDTPIDYSTVESAKATTPGIIRKKGELELKPGISATTTAQCGTYFGESREQFLSTNPNYKLLFTSSNGIDFFIARFPSGENFYHIIQAFDYNTDGNGGVRCYYYGWECSDGSYRAHIIPFPFCT